MADVLQGETAAWAFQDEAIHIRFGQGRRVPRLLRVLGERVVPYEALSEVSLVPGKRGTVVLSVRPRKGADPIQAVAEGQLRESHDPNRLVLPADRELLAEYYVDEMRRTIERLGVSDKPAPTCLVAAPPPPLRFTGYDGKAFFDGEQVTFQWDWLGAPLAKQNAGDQVFPVSQLLGVEWRSPDLLNGHLRLRVKGIQQPGNPDRDPATMRFGLGYGLTHETLPFAAAVHAAIVEAGVGTSPPPRQPGAPADPADIAERIRRLGELHAAGLLTEEEFRAKKAELLAQM